MKEDILEILNDSRAKVTRDSWSTLKFDIIDISRKEILEIFNKIEEIDVFEAEIRVDGTVIDSYSLSLLMDMDSNNNSKYDIVIQSNKKELVERLFPSTKELILFTSLNNFLKYFENNADQLSFEQRIKVLIFDDQKKKLVNPFIEIYFNKEFEIDTNYKEIDINNKRSIYQFIGLMKNYLLMDVSSIVEVPLFWAVIGDSSEISVLVLNQFLKLTANSIKGESYIYSGRNNVIVDYSDKNVKTSIDTDNLNKIITFLNSENNFLDRILILRNSLTRQLNSKSQINDFVDVVNNIYTYLTNEYQLFINQEVEIFLDKKDKLYIEALNLSNYISNLTNDISSYFRNVIVGLLGTVFVSILQNMLSNFSRPMITLILLSFTIYLFFMINVLHNLKDQKDNVVNNFESYLEDIPYKFEGTNFEIIKGKFLEETLKNFNKTYYKSKLMIYILIVLSFSMFIVFRWQIDFLYLKSISKFILGM